MDLAKIRPVELAYAAQKRIAGPIIDLRIEAKELSTSAQQWADEAARSKSAALALFHRVKADPKAARALRREAIAKFKWAATTRRFAAKDARQASELSAQALDAEQKAESALRAAIEAAFGANARIERHYDGFRIGMHSFA